MIPADNVYNPMLVTCIVCSHNKARYLPEAVASLLAQSWRDWQGILIDSGALIDAGFFQGQPWLDDPRLALLRSWETEETRRTKAIAPWVFNEVFRSGLVRGELVCWLCDDDVLYPDAFAQFVRFFSGHPDARAAYASEDYGAVYPDGRQAVLGERLATGVAGACCGGLPLDCVVDYLQLCVRREVLESVSWPEGLDTALHADGVFMEAIGSRWPIYPVEAKVGMNRRTPVSTYGPSL